MALIFVFFFIMFIFFLYIFVEFFKEFTKNRNLVKELKKFCIEKDNLESFLEDCLDEYLYNLYEDKINPEGEFSLHCNADYENNNISFIAEIYINYKDKKKKKLVSEIHRISINDCLDDYGILGNFILNEYDFDNKVTFKSINSFKEFIIEKEIPENLRSHVNFNQMLIEEDVFKTPFSVKEIYKEVKLEEKNALKEKIEISKENIVEKMWDIKKVSKDIGDIDISISISELSEDTEILLDMLSRMRSLSKINESYSNYIDSLNIILNLLNNFKTLKDSDSLSTEEENSIQDNIDVEISKCSKLVKFK